MQNIRGSAPPEYKGKEKLKTKIRNLKVNTKTMRSMRINTKIEELKSEVMNLIVSKEAMRSKTTITRVKAI